MRRAELLTSIENECEKNVIVTIPLCIFFLKNIYCNKKTGEKDILLVFSCVYCLIIYMFVDNEKNGYFNINSLS